MLRKLTAPLAAIMLLLGLASCAAAPSTDGDSAPTAIVSEGTIVLDVRTPSEYAAGHLKDAVLLDLNGGEFANVLPNLDAETEYLVYCRSGSRSGQAVAMMEQRGMTTVTDLGALEQAAAATGLPIDTN